MIRPFVLAAILIGLGSAVSAADLPTRKAPPAPPPPPVFTWTGFYFGGEVGGAWLSDHITETTAFVPPLTGHANLNLSGVTGGGLLGYNYELPNNWLVGAEGDFEGTSLSRTNGCQIQDAGAGNAAPGSCFPQTGAAYNGYSFSVGMPWQSSIRGRLGYAWGQALIYATGGVAFADIETKYTTGPGSALPGSQSFSQTAVGGTVGGGLEYALAPNWTVRVEYRWTDFGTISNNITSGGTFWNGYADHHDIQENSVRIGLTYLFGAPPAPVAARY